MLGLLGWPWSWELLLWLLAAIVKSSKKAKLFFLKWLVTCWAEGIVNERMHHYHSPFRWYFRLQGSGRAPRSTLLDEEIEGNCGVRVTPVFSVPGQWRKRRQKRKKWSEVEGGEVSDVDLKTLSTDESAELCPDQRSLEWRPFSGHRVLGDSGWIVCIDVHRQMNGLRSCGTYTQWNITQP